MSTLHRISGCDSPQREADVSFVHGLGGDAFTTWRHDEADGSWPYWLGEEFPNVGVWSLGYAASISKRSRFFGWLPRRNRDAGYAMALPARALQVVDLLAQRGIGERPIFFICHSLGGLLTKQILRRSMDSTDPGHRRIADNTRAVLFLATPHAGATLATLLDQFRTVFGSTVSIEDLREHDPHLHDLHDWYRNHGPTLGIETATYYEDRGIAGMVRIVNPTSAHPGVGANPIALDEDHVSIAKPRDRESQVYGKAAFLLRQAVLAPRKLNAAVPQPPLVTPSTVEGEFVAGNASTALGAGTGVRVPRELPPGAEQFFGRQAQRERLTERLRASLSTAVVGSAGMGKTALAAASVRDVVGASAAELAESPYPDGVIFLDLYTTRAQAEAAWNIIANKLAGPEFRETSPAEVRARHACSGRQFLLVIEGGEDADGEEGRTSFSDLVSVLSEASRWLLLTRVSTQVKPEHTVKLNEALNPDEAAELFASLCGEVVSAELRQDVLKLLEGHPLALTWAGNLLARGDEDPARLVSDWNAQGVLGLSDPVQAEHTLEWLFGRSVRGLDETTREVLAAAGLLARAPIPIEALQAALGDDPDAAARTRAAVSTLIQRGLLRLSSKENYREFTHVLGYLFARKESGDEPELRERLAHWLRAHLTSSLAPDAVGLGINSVGPALEHAAALPHGDADQRLWSPLVQYLLYSGTDRLISIGRLDLARSSLDAAGQWLERCPEETNWVRERAVLLNRRGEVLTSQGDLSGALASYKEALAISQLLAQADPSNTEWQRDLSVSQNKVGGVLRAQGDLAGALESYHKSLNARQRLAQVDLSNTHWQRDVSVSQDNVGSVLKAQGDLAGALASYRESLSFSQRLAQADPSNTEWQRDVSVSQNNVGGVLQAQGDLPGALASYKEALEASQRLAQADPSNTEWQRDVSVSQNKVGGVLQAQGDLAGALASYKESLSARQRLAQADPSNTEWQRDVSVSQHKVGGVLQAQGDLAGALASYMESLNAQVRLAQADPSNTDWQRDLSVSQNKVGGVLQAQGDLPGALASYTEALAVSQRLAQADPSNTRWQRDLSFAMAAVALVSAVLGDLVSALTWAEESLLIDERLATLDPTNATWRTDVAVSGALVARLRALSSR